MAQKVTDGELRDYASRNGVDVDEMDYAELREKIDINECWHCETEFLEGWSSKFCTEACENQYRNKYHTNCL